MANLKKLSTEQEEHSIRQQKLKLGFGGHLGAGENRKINIFFIIAGVVLLPGLVLIMFTDFKNGMSYLAWASPILTLLFGYIAGRRLDD